jgi:hypothetical protein
MQALCIYAGPLARRHIEISGLQPGDVGTIPAAAGGPKGLILGPLDEFVFGHWLAQTRHEIHLVGASIGAWRMATACLGGRVETGTAAQEQAEAGGAPHAIGTDGFKRLAHDYIHQHYEPQPGEKRPTAHHISEKFGQGLQRFYAGRVAEVLNHPRYRLHIITSRGRHILRTEHALRSRLGYLGAFLTNTVHRKSMGAWLERVVFSSQKAALPFTTSDYRTRQVALSPANFMDALQASCSIPFVLNSVRNIAGAPPGAYWDGGITDYHLHLNYTDLINTPDSIANYISRTWEKDVFYPSGSDSGAPGPAQAPATGSRRAALVFYPHFQKAVVPGWLDKGLKWRHKATGCLDTMVLLAPNPDWVKTLPNGKLPDRVDFTHYSADLAGRIKAWTAAASASRQLADEFAAWLERPDMGRVLPL